MSLKEDLELFFNHFETFRKSIIETNYNYAPEISQSVLLCSIIDTISNVAYPNSNLLNNQKLSSIDQIDPGQFFACFFEKKTSSLIGIVCQFRNCFSSGINRVILRKG